MSFNLFRVSSLHTSGGFKRNSIQRSLFSVIKRF